MADITGAQVAQIVQSIGLLADIGGVILLWRFGLMGEVASRGLWFTMNSKLGKPKFKLEDAGEWNVRSMREAERAQKWSPIAITLLVSGFVLQLIATWIPS